MCESRASVDGKVLKSPTRKSKATFVIQQTHPSHFTTNMSSKGRDLPFEVITDILSRLPVKSLLRFRAVSQSFYALIDSTHFIKHHLSNNRNRNLILGGLGVYSINIRSLDIAVYLKVPHRCSDISNSCNGLFLVLDKNPYLWNPFTRKYKDIPKFTINDPGQDGAYASNEILGFGYDVKNDDYRVLKLVEFRGVNLEWICSRAYVYSCRSNAWRRIKDFPYQVHCKKVWRLYLNSALHTIVMNEYSGLSLKIMAFDFVSEEHYKVEGPEIPVKEFNIVGLDVLDEYLCVLNAKRQHRIDVWIMKEYRKKESWTKLLSIAPPDIERYSSLSPLVFSSDGNRVLLNCDDKWLVWYDLKEKKATTVTVEGLPFIFNAELSVESLIGFDDSCGAGKVRLHCSKQDKRRCRNKRDDFLSEGFKLVL